MAYLRFGIWRQTTIDGGFRTAIWLGPHLLVSPHSSTRVAGSVSKIHIHCMFSPFNGILTSWVWLDGLVPMGMYGGIFGLDGASRHGGREKVGLGGGGQKTGPDRLKRIWKRGPWSWARCTLPIYLQVLDCGSCRKH